MPKPSSLPTPTKTTEQQISLLYDVVTNCKRVSLRANEECNRLFDNVAYFHKQRRTRDIIPDVRALFERISDTQTTAKHAARECNHAQKMLEEYSNLYGEETVRKIITNED
jgi:hypothetical protein